ncbi:MAG TPA: hypothetical protein VK730_09695 [Solirubrobacteraceae bacterium]|nr:hypothetical protein [Solirubrobacteraceae bacterium]
MQRIFCVSFIKLATHVSFVTYASLGRFAAYRNRFEAQGQAVGDRHEVGFRIERRVTYVTQIQNNFAVGTAFGLLGGSRGSREAEKLQ